VKLVSSLRSPELKPNDKRLSTELRTKTKTKPQALQLGLGWAREQGTRHKEGTCTSNVLPRPPTTSWLVVRWLVACSSWLLAPGSWQLAADSSRSWQLLELLTTCQAGQQHTQHTTHNTHQHQRQTPALDTTHQLHQNRAPQSPTPTPNHQVPSGLRGGGGLLN
jgi:hypothetical protein